MDPVEIDLVKYGALWQKVQDYERRFEVANTRLDKMQGRLEEVLILARKGKGGFWAGMTIASSANALLSILKVK